MFVTIDDKVFGFGENENAVCGQGYDSLIEDPVVIPKLCDKGVKEFFNGFDFVLCLTSKVVAVWEFPKMTSREFPGISRFFGKTRAGNGKKHIEIFAPKLQRHF